MSEPLMIMEVERMLRDNPGMRISLQANRHRFSARVTGGDADMAILVADDSLEVAITKAVDKYREDDDTLSVEAEGT